MFPEVNYNLRTPEEVAAEREKIGRGKCVCSGCENDVAANYRMCREHILPLLDIMHASQWSIDARFLRMSGVCEETIKRYGENIKYGFELLE